MNVVRKPKRVIHVSRRYELEKYKDASHELAATKRKLAHSAEQCIALQKQLNYAVRQDHTGMISLLLDFKNGINQNLNYLDFDHASRLFEDMFDRIVANTPLPEKEKKKLYFRNQVRALYG